jgi:hypothetical protein
MIPGLFIKAPTELLNPTLDAAVIAAAMADDPEAARSEWLGEFRSDTSDFLDDELIDRAIEPGRRELPFLIGHNYVAFCDPSGGRHDAMTLGIAHPEKHRFANAEGRRVVLDRLVIQQPPFDPEVVVQRFTETLRAFGLTTVTGDRYAAAWVTSAFRKYGITYQPSELDKSAIYVETLPAFSQGLVELLDVPPLITQLRLLERRPRAGGKGDIVDHPPRASDDAANAACGALWLASKARVEKRDRSKLPKVAADAIQWETDR